MGEKRKGDKGGGMEGGERGRMREIERSLPSSLLHPAVWSGAPSAYPSHVPLSFSLCRCEMIKQETVFFLCVMDVLVTGMFVLVSACLTLCM